MKMKFKLLVAAAALAVAGQASAALTDITSTDGSGSSLMLVVWDTNGNSYVRDLGTTADQVVSGSYTASGTVSSGSSSTLFTTLFGSDTASNVSYTILGDTKSTSNHKNIISGVDGSGGYITDNNFGTIESKISALITLANGNPNGNNTGNEYNTTGDTTVSGSKTTNLFSYLAGGVGNVATLGTTLNLTGFQQAGNISGSTHGTTLSLAGSTNFTLNANGDLLVPAAVPLPAAVWLMGSGLLGLLGVGRRRKALEA